MIQIVFLLALLLLPSQVAADGYSCPNDPACSPCRAGGQLVEMDGTCSCLCPGGATACLSYGQGQFCAESGSIYQMDGWNCR